MNRSARFVLAFLAGLLLCAGVSVASTATVAGASSDSALQCFTLDPAEPFSRSSAPDQGPTLGGPSPRPLDGVCCASLRVSIEDAATLSATRCGAPRAAPRPVYLTTARLRL